MPRTSQAPLLDRRGILGIAAQGSRTNGVYQSGAVTEHAIWYALRDWDVAIDVQPEGTRQRGDIELITRYRRDVIVEALNNRAFVGWYLDMDGVRFKLLDAEEMPMYGRRRFMKIKGARSS